ncbi:MAG: hypothetical protein ACOC0N_11865 [Chroococcales cyanobacterium]
MVILVVVFNLLLAIANFYIAWRIWKIRRSLINVTDSLTSIDRTIYNIFYPAAPIIIKGQTGTSNLRNGYQKLSLQLQRIQDIFTALTLISNVWQPQSRRKPRPVNTRRRRRKADRLV